MARSPLLSRIRNRTARLRERRWRMAAHRSSQRHIVMGGAPRSGTTLLRKVFDRHPQICSGAETKLFVPAGYNLEWLAQSYSIDLPEVQAMRAAAPSQAAFIDAFASRARADANKERWAEKTPQNIRVLGWAMERFPKASIIHIIRDGRDVVCSMRQHPDWRWVDGQWQKVLVPRTLEWYAQRWLDDVAAGKAWRGDPRYVEVRYEDLVADPRRVLADVCDGIGATADMTWLDDVGNSEERERHTKRPDYEGAVSGTSVGRWREDLSTDEQTLVRRLLGPRLIELGYEW